MFEDAIGWLSNPALDALTGHPLFKETAVAAFLVAQLVGLHTPPPLIAALTALLVVQATLTIAAAIIAEASLSFLGLGQQPPEPSWGSMLNVAKNFLEQAPWMAIWPGASIFLAVLAFNLLGDGLRDALDPRMAKDV